MDSRLAGARPATWAAGSAIWVELAQRTIAVCDRLIDSTETAALLSDALQDLVHGCRHDGQTLVRFQQLRLSADEYRDVCGRVDVVLAHAAAPASLRKTVATRAALWMPRVVQSRGGLDLAAKRHLDRVAKQKGKGSMQVRSNSTLNQALAGVQAASAYERLGGRPAVRSVVDVFYQRVLADDQLVSYFDGLDSSQLARVKRHQIELISHVLGGPTQYPVETLRATHGRLKIQPHHYRRTVHLLLGTLWEFRVEEDIILEVGELLHSLQSVIALDSESGSRAKAAA